MKKRTIKLAKLTIDSFITSEKLNAIRGGDDHFTVGICDPRNKKSASGCIQCSSVGGDC